MISWAALYRVLIELTHLILLDIIIKTIVFQDQAGSALGFENLVHKYIQKFSKLDLL